MTRFLMTRPSISFWVNLRTPSATNSSIPRPSLDVPIGTPEMRRVVHSALPDYLPENRVKYRPGLYQLRNSLSHCRKGINHKPRCFEVKDSVNYRLRHSGNTFVLDSEKIHVEEHTGIIGLRKVQTIPRRFREKRLTTLGEGDIDHS